MRQPEVFTSRSFQLGQTEALTALLGAGPATVFCRPVSGGPFPSGRGAFSRRDVGCAAPGPPGGAFFLGGAGRCAALWCGGVVSKERGGERQGCARPRTISSKAA